MEFLLTGFGLQDFVSFIVREVVGIFYILARFRWFWDPSRYPLCWFNGSRHEKLVNRLCTCGYLPHPCLAAAVATTEVVGGILLVLGLATTFAALGIFVVMVFATYCTATESVKEQNPVDCVDCVSRYLYTVEPLYLMLSGLVVLMGPGRWSLDWLLFG